MRPKDGLEGVVIVYGLPVILYATNFHRPAMLEELAILFTPRPSPVTPIVASGPAQLYAAVRSIAKVRVVMRAVYVCEVYPKDRTRKTSPDQDRQ